MSSFISPKDITLSICHQNGLAVSYRRLVYDEYLKRGWITEEKYPNLECRDEFDQHSNFVVLHQDANALAGMRLVHDTPLGFPHESVLNLERLKEHAQNHPHYPTVRDTGRSGIAEITRVAGKIKHQPFLYNVAKGLYWYAKHHNITYYLMVVDLDFFRLCDHVGIPIHPFGVPYRYDGSWAIPAITIPDEYLDSIKHSEYGKSFILDKNTLGEGWSARVDMNDPMFKITPSSVY